MDSTKISVAIVIGAGIIGCAIYFGLTEQRREFMGACIANVIRNGNSPDSATYICANAFKS